jgi:hypothetical protein
MIKFQSVVELLLMVVPVVQYLHGFGLWPHQLNISVPVVL